ncbi:RING/U-box superfamily protein isoform 1 [Theobroma cacao]|uniref:RING/U-box superfamily protein isoform 1 n=2 Tax=Theobroma cacao TaxID=3641 RepID=A0A061GP53_THECC|nr:RING/U-box superfamily protein isoform 1 [Theobroma cacao]
MGSSSSRLGSNPSRGRLNHRPKWCSRLSSLFICGGSSSQAPLEMEDYPAEILVKSAEHCGPVGNMVQSPLEESTSICSMETRFSSTGTETGISAESSSAASGDPSIEGGSRDLETSNCRKCLIESTELVAPQVSADYSCGESHRDSSTSASTSFKEQQSSDPISVNLSTNEDAVSGFENANKGASQIHPEPSILSPQGLGDSHLHGIPVENQLSEVTTVHNSDPDPAPHASEPVTFHSPGGESIREAIPSGLGFLVSNREPGRGDGSVLHVDVVSISSNILSGGSADTSNREARRNSRRLFWDAFSRRSSRRLNDSSSIFLSTDDSDDTGFHDRWLLDFSGDFFYDGAGGDSGYLSSRIHSLNERRRHSRSEIWERLRGGHDENSRRTTFCPSGLHPDGTCSCDSLLMTDESSARASISRIVMLAEALFEVLDEIHRQPVSLSLSMVSLPAPESVVDSFPLRSHKKLDAAEGGDAVEQCYICLAEYEEEDKIRALPCQHEFHMSCVDKWLKEIHGVCPLCRGDVRQGVESSVSNSEIPSL